MGWLKGERDDAAEPREAVLESSNQDLLGPGCGDSQRLAPGKVALQHCLSLNEQGL